MAFTMKIFQSGFRVTFIWPFNENVFEDAEFQSAYLTHQPTPDAALSSTGIIVNRNLKLLWNIL